MAHPIARARIDSVYQRVLAKANKEQRGYITPQEFNLYAKQAQMEILDQYFYDINQFSRIPGNGTEHSDVLDMLNQKLSYLKINDTNLISSTFSTSGLFGVNRYWILPNNLYRLGTILWNTEGTFSFRRRGYGTPVDRITNKELVDIIRSPLVRPNRQNPVYVEVEEGIVIYPEPPIKSEPQETVTASYIRVPYDPKWGYNVVGEKALYNPGTTIEFSLHRGEESELVRKILIFAGISIKDINVYQAAAAEDNKNTQQEKQ